ncbi:MAG: hypothetical protein MI919_12260, partial [Holophagales bacterium]|nr:hypothetical protein [Holophagales bacterium]
AGLGSLALWLREASEPAAAPRADDPVQLTTDPGLEIDPAFSSDGHHLVYASNRGGGFELYARPWLAGGQERQITDDGRRNVQPTLSSDGAWLAYVSQGPGGIWLMPASGGAPRRVTDFGSHPTFTPDGRALIFQEDARKEISERTLPAMPPSTLWRVGLTSGDEPERITRAGEPVGGHGEPAISPDGRFVAFSSGNRRRSQVWILELATGEVRPLLSEARINANPLFSSDGESLLYLGISSSGRQSAAYAVWHQALDPQSGEAEGRPERVLRLGLATLRQIALSPSNDRLVYAALSTVSELRALRLDADDRPLPPSRTLARRGQRNSRPSFSPGGDRLAFDRWQMGTNLDIWTADLPAQWLSPPAGDGLVAAGPLGERRITFDPEWDSQSTWTADGDSLAYFSEREGRRGLWTVDLETGQSRFLADIGRDADWARLSPDGERIAYHSSQDSASLDVWIHHLPSGSSRRLTRDPHLAGFPVWSPDGRSLAVEIRRDGSTHLAVLELEAGTAAAENTSSAAAVPEQITFEAGESWPYSWSPDGRRVAFAGRRDGVWNLYWVDRSSREVIAITDRNDLDGYLRYPSWSPRGNLVAYEQATTVGDLWWVKLEPAAASSAGSG